MLWLISAGAGYETSLFEIFTPEWLFIRPHGDFVQGLIISPPVEKSWENTSLQLRKNIGKLFRFNNFQKYSKFKKIKFLLKYLIIFFIFLRIFHFQNSNLTGNFKVLWDQFEILSVPAISKKAFLQALLDETIKKFKFLKLHVSKFATQNLCWTCICWTLNKTLWR